MTQANVVEQPPLKTNHNINLNVQQFKVSTEKCESWLPDPDHGRNIWGRS